MVLLHVGLVLVLHFKEGFAAFAVIRLIRIVHAQHVLLEMGQLSERFLAELAHVWLLSGVHSQV